MNRDYKWQIRVDNTNPEIKLEAIIHIQNPPYGLLSKIEDLLKRAKE